MADNNQLDNLSKGAEAWRKWLQDKPDASKDGFHLFRLIHI